jgi:hypothetical protein
MIRLAALPVALLALLPVETKPFDLRWSIMDRMAADAAQASAGDLCFVETGHGNAKRRTPYILDFNGQCPPMDSAAYRKKNIRYHMSK